jgi:hypothetical protein
MKNLLNGKTNELWAGVNVEAAKWFVARNYFLGIDGQQQDAVRGLELARASKHEDAQWLCGLFPTLPQDSRDWRARFLNSKPRNGRALFFAALSCPYSYTGGCGMPRTPVVFLTPENLQLFNESIKDYAPALGWACTVSAKMAPHSNSSLRTAPKTAPPPSRPRRQ